MGRILEGKKNELFNNKGLLLAITIILVLTISMILYILPISKNSAEVERIAYKFIENIMSGNIKMAQEVSTGVVKYNLASSHQSGKYEISDIELKTVTFNNGLAEINATIKTEQPSSIFWYKILLIKKNDWKVYYVEDTDPILSRNTNIKELEIEKAQEVFTSYANKVQNGNYVLASKYLIGKARITHKKSKQLFEKMTTGKASIEVYNLQTLHSNSNELILLIDYFLEDRKVSALVSFYKLNNQWKIYSISQV